MSVHSLPVGARRNVSKSNGSNSGSEPPMELIERVARVEEKISGLDKRLGLVEADLRELIKKVDSHFLVVGGMIVALGVGLAGLMAKGFHWL